MLQNLKLTSQNKILAFSFVILIILWALLSTKNNNAKEEYPPEKNKTFYADTLIPKGFVLIPVDLANVEAVAGLIDQFGVVDLYSGPENNSVLVASRVKILRAPLNPNKYAVMIPETQSQDMMRIKGPLLAVVLNRFAKSEIVKPAQTLPVQAIKKVPAPAQSPKQGQYPQIEIEYYQGGSR